MVVVECKKSWRAAVVISRKRQDLQTIAFTITITITITIAVVLFQGRCKIYKPWFSSPTPLSKVKEYNHLPKAPWRLSKEDFKRGREREVLTATWCFRPTKLSPPTAPFHTLVTYLRERKGWVEIWKCYLLSHLKESKEIGEVGQLAVIV